MREQRYRVFDVKRGQYLKLASDIDNNVCISPYEDGSGRFVLCGVGGLSQPLKFEQFTGLIDRNGVEVYEGDIVAILRRYSLHGEQFDGVMFWGEVRIYPSQGATMISPRHKDFITGNINKVSPSITIRAKRAQVLGNIHEHPHILESGNA